MFYNPFDISKDGKNSLVDGIRFHIRESEQIKEQIKEYYVNNEYKYCSAEYTAQEVLDEIMLNNLNIDLNDLTIADEHELLDWINCKL